MKHSQKIGFLLALMMVAFCFLPLVVIESKQIVVTGFDSSGTYYGKPGIVMSVFCGICALLFLVPKIWAKRTNVFIAAFALAWVIRNYFILSACQAGECPQKQVGLFLLLGASVTMMLMALLPKIELPTKN
jgi:hypothetical protein